MKTKLQIGRLMKIQRKDDTLYQANYRLKKDEAQPESLIYVDIPSLSEQPYYWTGKCDNFTLQRL